MLRRVSWIILLLIAVLLSGCFGGRSSRVYHTLTIEIEGQGTTIPQEGERRYAQGTIVDITANPADNFQFSHMLGDVSPVANGDGSRHYQTPMDKSKTITAVFTQIHDINPVIQTVAPVMDFSVPFGTSRSEIMDYLLSRRNRVWIVDSNGQRVPVSVSWDLIGYQPTQPGSYPAEATFELPVGIGQNDDSPVPLEFTTWVEVLRDWPKITGIADVGDVTVPWGTTESQARAALARETTITDADGRTHNVSLTWEIIGYDHERAGTYEAVGRFRLPDRVSQTMPPTDLEVHAEISVNPRPQAEIRNVIRPDDIWVSWGTERSDVERTLAQSVIVVDEFYQPWRASVEGWTVGGYDATTPDRYEAVTRFLLPAEVRQTDPPFDTTLRVWVNVADRELPYLDRIVWPNVINSVDFGTTWAELLALLPATVAIYDNEGTGYDPVLSWTLSGHDPQDLDNPLEHGVRGLRGRFDLPANEITQSAPPKNLFFDTVVTVLDQESSRRRVAEVLTADGRGLRLKLVQVYWNESVQSVHDKLGHTVTVVDHLGREQEAVIVWNKLGHELLTPGDYRISGELDLRLRDFEPRFEDAPFFALLDSERPQVRVVPRTEDGKDVVRFSPTPTAVDGGTGSVSVESQTVTDGVHFPVETNVTLIAEPGEGSQFVRWMGDIETATPEVPFLITRDNHQISAEFERKEYLVEFELIGRDGNPVDLGPLSTQIIRYGDSARDPSRDPQRAPGVDLPGYEVTWEPSDFVSISEDLRIVGEYTEILFPLTVVIDGDGNVSDLQAGISFSETDQARFREGTILELEAQASAHWEFSQWGQLEVGDIVDGSTVSIEISRSRNIQAVFEREQYDVRFEDHDGNLVGNPQVIPYEGSAIPPDLPDTLPGFKFVGWDGDYDFIDSDRTIQAVYDPILYSVHVQIVGEGTVEVDLGSESVILTESDTLSALPYDSEVSLRAIGGSGTWVFLGWSGDIVSSEEMYSFRVRDDMALQAGFSDQYYRVGFYRREDPLNNSSPLVAIGDPVDVLRNGSVALPDAPHVPGMQFSGEWESASSLTIEDGQLVRINESLTVIARYEPVEVTVRFLVFVDGVQETVITRRVEVRPQRALNNRYLVGSFLTLRAIPSDSLRFDRWGGEIDDEELVVDYRVGAEPEQVIELHFSSID